MAWRIESWILPVRADSPSRSGRRQTARERCREVFLAPLHEFVSVVSNPGRDANAVAIFIDELRMLGLTTVAGKRLLRALSAQKPHARGWRFRSAVMFAR